MVKIGQCDIEIIGEFGQTNIENDICDTETIRDQNYKNIQDRTSYYQTQHICNSERTLFKRSSNDIGGTGRNTYRYNLDMGVKNGNHY